MDIIEPLSPVYANLPLCRIRSLGRVPYADAFALQRQLVAERAAGHIPDTLLLVEHPPTVTMGRATKAAHLLLSADALHARGIALVESDRGGDVTYHAPGQIVAYPILKLSHYGGDVLRYLRMLEELVIYTVADYGIAAGRIQGLTGVWVDPENPTQLPADPANLRAKIAAVGVRLSASGVTSHGLALNVNIDPAEFGIIVPCGISDRAVTSLHLLTANRPSLEAVQTQLIAHMTELFRWKVMIE